MVERLFQGGIDRKDEQGCTPAIQGVTSVYHHLFLSNAGSVMRVTLCSHGFVNSPLSKKATSRIICEFRSSLTEMTKPVLNP